ncbi:subunit of TIM23 translocase complex [Nowakowskiella sp. JEL0407]|nr:subunit of TIM23 translocase complex [Nowakowskiella sp. JEL0407]
MKLGAVMGISVGVCLGFCSGAYVVLFYGPGSKGYLRTMGQHMIQSGTLFGCIMTFGQLLRADGEWPSNPKTLTCNSVPFAPFNRHRPPLYDAYKYQHPFPVPPETNPRPQSFPPRRSIQTTPIGCVFQLNSWILNAPTPKHTRNSPLHSYYSAENKLAQKIKKLHSLAPPHNNYNDDAYRSRCAKIHIAQWKLLDAIYRIYDEYIPNYYKSSRAYLSNLTYEDQHELSNRFSENILFAAQALSHGYRIRGIEQFSNDLYEHAAKLLASSSALRFVFCGWAVEKWKQSREWNVVDFEREFGPVVNDFDQAWTCFEERICLCYFSVYNMGLSGTADNKLVNISQNHSDMFQILLSETIIYAKSNSYFTSLQISTYDPALIISTPRLSIVTGLLYYPNYINMTHPIYANQWFKDKSCVLMSLQEKLNILRRISKDLVKKLEERIVFGDSDGVKSECDEVNEVEFVSAQSQDQTHERINENDDSDAEIFKMNRTPTLTELDIEAVDHNNIGDFGTSILIKDESGQKVFTHKKSVQFAGLPQRMDSLYPINYDVDKVDVEELMQESFRTICFVADEFQSGPRAKDFVRLLQNVFMMHS